MAQIFTFFLPGTDHVIGHRSVEPGVGISALAVLNNGHLYLQHKCFGSFLPASPTQPPQQHFPSLQLFSPSAA